MRLGGLKIDGYDLHIKVLDINKATAGKAVVPRVLLTPVLDGVSKTVELVWDEHPQLMFILECSIERHNKEDRE